jgi:cytochrome P450/NADPH-cytochrome P450 reductase
MVMAMILQNFDMQLDDPAYQLRIQQALTIKPKDLFIRVSLREGSPTDLDQKIHSNNQAADPKQQPKQATTAPSSTKVARANMLIVYGSNTGTCQAFAQRLASDAITHGFEPEVKEMDAIVDNMPKQCPIIFITSSYEGQAPDNAARFVEWLKSSEEKLDGIRFAVFGCGHSKYKICEKQTRMYADWSPGDWSTTFHRIPKLVDQLMGQRCARRIVSAGFANIAKGNVFGDFEDWLDRSLWPELASTADDTMASPIEIEISTQARASSLRYDIGVGVVKEVKKLTAAGEPVKCHLEVQLPSEMSTYECGDYLAVLPLNPDKLVRRVMAHFHLPWDAVITMKTTGPSVIPCNVPLSVYDVLRSYVELSQPATKKVRHCFAAGISTDFGCRR